MIQTRYNQRLYRDWQRKRAAEGYAERPGNITALERLEEFHDGAALDTLTTAGIRDWLGSLDGMAPSSRKTYFSAVRAFYNFLEDDEIIARSPMRRMSEPKNPPRPVPIPSDEHIAALLDVTGRDKSPMGKRDHAMLRTMLDTGGPRASEVAAMLIYGEAPKPRHTLGLDLDRDQITVIGKGDQVRTWPISAKTARAQSVWMRARAGLRGAGTPELWLGFRARAGHSPTRSLPRRVLEVRCGEAGIPPIHPHQLRHKSYDAFLRAGGRKRDAMYLYGWRSETMPNYYASALDADRALEAGHTLAIGDRW